MDAALPAEALRGLLAGPAAVTLIDVRREAAFVANPVLIPGALRRLPEGALDWGPTLPSWRQVVVYCVHGREVGRDAAGTLRALGLDARHLAGGLAGWREAGGATLPWRPPTRWATRERPKIDRLACPWFLRRFVDPDAIVDYVPAERVIGHAARSGATPFDVPGVEYGHDGDRCSFDAFVARHRPDDAALARLADIVRAADTGRLAAVPQASGLLAVSAGLGRVIASDHALLHHALLVYDALYAWCRAAEDARRDVPAHARRVA